MFKDAGSFIATLIHEMGHSTGHASRLNRTFGRHFGDPGRMCRVRRSRFLSGAR
ncbi:zincin-like metallopeptidase domain-containing protein [Blautia producta]|uniref:zincin-like metallopeptidase domain-containing protein n=1 Tax=Blautia TaxID=572511 RepID=UPI0004B3515E